MDRKTTYPTWGRRGPRLFAIIAGVLLAATVGFYVDAAKPSEPLSQTITASSKGGAGPTCAVKGECLLRFVNQPNSTQTGSIIKSGYDSTGDPIRVEIYDPASGAVVRTNALVTLARYYYPSGGALSGAGPVAAVNGVASFTNLSINIAGAYKVRASSAAASNTPISALFMISDVVDACSGPTCAFEQTQGKNSYQVDPATGTRGATFVASLNLAGLRVSCDFAPYSYPDSRQPNSAWFVYTDGSTESPKTVTITIDKSIVQLTAENGASFYRVCYTSPDRFTDRNGNPAPPDPWTAPLGGLVGPSRYFGTTWYTGLLPDCKAVGDVAPCVVSWTGGQGGDRVGVFITPPGDPGYR